MLYHTVPDTDPALSILGFGCMRLPVDGDGHIDEPRAAEMLRWAIDHGVNYVDTAYPYHNGESEPFVGRALQDGYRSRVQLATKLPSWLVTSRADMDKYLDEQLKRLQTRQIDFYLVHSLNQASWENMQRLGIGEFLDGAIADGRIRYAGFSFHDQADVFKKIVGGYDWSFCQIQYNFMDEDYQAGTEGLHYTASRGLGIVVMEPLRGGVLTREVPAVQDVWNRASTKRTLADWALRWIWNHPEVSVVLSGMGTLEQVRENIESARTATPSCLSTKELSLFDLAREEYRKRIKVPCTSCNYCIPCPSGVKIPTCFEIYNLAHMYDAADRAKGLYEFMLRAGTSNGAGFASQCKECGDCEELCPQGISTREQIREVAAFFGK
ncbi:MAG: aldo/keto reductase [candidate division Zixibacteria bacterium]|nr:aldo/keto reductase [candidate division Zixibacteria bacterium]